MKKNVHIFLICLLVLVPGSVFAAGTVTQTLGFIGKNVVCLTFTWTADAANGSVPATWSRWDIDGYVYLVMSNPGSPAPTDNYDLKLVESQGTEITGSELPNRDTANTETVVPKIDKVYGSRFVAGKILLQVTGNSVNSAVGVVKVYYTK